MLAALAGGGSMTAGQVAAKAGLARPTVSTTLSKLAKTGDVQKPARLPAYLRVLGAIGSDIPELRSRGPRYLTLRVSSTVGRSRTAAARGGMLLFGLRGDVER